jgi:hypothetical protein
VEVFANGTVCITKVVTPFDSGPALVVRTEGGTARVKRLRAWPMKTIWQAVW